MKRRTYILPLFLFLSIFAFAQQQDSSRINPYSGSQQPKKTTSLNKMYFGGTLYFTLGSGYTSIGVWPLAGYKLTPKLSVGLQPGYEYLKYNSYYGGTFETSNYGVRIFTRYRIIPQAYAHVEFADINYGREVPKFPDGYEKVRDWVPFLFVGGGLSQPLGGSSFAYVQVLYDVLQDKNSPYGSSELFWSVGVIAGF